MNIGLEIDFLRLEAMPVCNLHAQGSFSELGAQQFTVSLLFSSQIEVSRPGTEQDQNTRVGPRLKTLGLPRQVNQ